MKTVHGCRNVLKPNRMEGHKQIFMTSDGAFIDPQAILLTCNLAILGLNFPWNDFQVECDYAPIKVNAAQHKVHETLVCKSLHW